MNITNIIRTPFAILLAFTISGCTTAYEAAVDVRSLEEQTEDAKIEARVKQVFFDNKNVKALSTSIYSFYGDVYLVGEAESKLQISESKRLAKQVEGVKSVTTWMPIKRSNDLCGITDNISIKMKTYTEMAKDDDVSVGQIEIKSVQCTVVLMGLVKHGSQIRKAIEIAKRVEGVRGVKSYLKVVNP